MGAGLPEGTVSAAWPSATPARPSCGWSGPTGLTFGDPPPNAFRPAPPAPRGSPDSPPTRTGSSAGARGDRRGRLRGGLGGRGRVHRRVLRPRGPHRRPDLASLFAAPVRPRSAGPGRPTGWPPLHRRCSRAARPGGYVAAYGVGAPTCRGGSSSRARRSRSRQPDWAVTHPASSSPERPFRAQRGGARSRGHARPTFPGSIGPHRDRGVAGTRGRRRGGGRARGGRGRPLGRPARFRGSPPGAAESVAWGTRSTPPQGISRPTSAASPSRGSSPATGFRESPGWTRRSGGSSPPASADATATVPGDRRPLGALT